jgi:hypothetical protein
MVAHITRSWCPCRRFASVLEQFGVPYYLKVDIEGNDILCLQDLNPQRLPKFVSMESASPDLITLMAGRGFKRFKAISQYNFLPIECASCAPSYRAFSPRPAMCCRRAWCTHCFFDNVTESSLGAGETLVDGPPQKSCATYLNPRCSPEGYLARDLF